MRRKYNGVWQPEQEVAAFLASSGFTATPVVSALGTFCYLIVWRDYDSPGLRIRAFNDNNDSLGTATAIPGTNSNSFYPTMSKDTHEFCHLAWAESGTIYYTKISFNDSTYTFSPSKENVSSGTYDWGHTYPSITTDYSRRPNVAWQTGAEQVIIHRRRELSGAWSSANIFIGSDLYNTPSITGYPNAPNNNLAIVWRRDPTTTRLARYVNSVWSEYTQSSGGYHPNLSATMSGGTPASKFVVRGSTAPYTITTSSENLPKANPLKVAQYRRGVFVIGDKEIAYDLGEIFYRDQFAEKPVALFPYVDTLVVGLTASWEEMFRTENIQLSDQSQLRFNRKVIAPASLAALLPVDGEIKFELQVVEAATNNALASIDQATISHAGLVGGTGTKTVQFGATGKKEVYLLLRPTLSSSLMARQSMAELYIDRAGAASSATAEAEDSEVVDLVPKELALAGNYPNPFNPSTRIVFSLPEAQEITLTIYNVLGQKIRTLANGIYRSGRYDLVWDGRDDNSGIMPSGMYFSRLEVGGKVLTSKMMLVH